MLKTDITFAFELEKPNSGNLFAVLFWILLRQVPHNWPVFPYAVCQHNLIQSSSKNSSVLRTWVALSRCCKNLWILFFFAQRVRGKRGRVAYGKMIFFGVMKCQGKVYMENVPDCSKITLRAITRWHAAPNTIIYSIGWRGYAWLIHISFVISTSGFIMETTSFIVANDILMISNLSEVLQKGV